MFDNRRAAHRSFLDHPANGVEIDERPHGVMHGHDIGIGVEGRERFLDGFLPGIAARHNAQKS